MEQDTAVEMKIDKGLWLVHYIRYSNGCEFKHSKFIELRESMNINDFEELFSDEVIVNMVEVGK